MALSIISGITSGLGIINGLFGGGGSQAQGQISSQAAAIGNQQNQNQQYYNTQLQNLMANPSSVTQQPGYQFAMDQAITNTGRQYAAGGRNMTPGMEEAQLMAGAGVAQNFFTSQEQLLAGIAGLQFNPAAAFQTSSNAGTAAAAQNSSAFGQLGASLSPGSNGQPGGAIYQAYNKIFG